MLQKDIALLQKRSNSTLKMSVCTENLLPGEFDERQAHDTYEWLQQHHHEQCQQHLQHQQQQCQQVEPQTCHLMGYYQMVGPPSVSQLQDRETFMDAPHYIHHHHHHHQKLEQQQLQQQQQQHEEFNRENHHNLPPEHQHTPNTEVNHIKESVAFLRKKNSTGFHKTGLTTTEFQEINQKPSNKESPNMLEGAVREPHWFEKSSESKDSIVPASLTLRKLRKVSFLMVLALLSSSFAAVSATMQFVEKPTNTSQLLGQSVVLRCSIRNLSGDVQWSKNDQLLGRDRQISYYPRLSMLGEDDNGFGVATYDLKIANIELSDQAAYVCQVPTSTAYPMGLKSEPAYLSVIVPPKNLTLTQGEDGVEVYLNTPTNITCRAYKSKPAARIIFRINGQRVDAENYAVPNGDYHDTIGILTFNASKAMMSSIVQCEASIPNFEHYMQQPLRVSKILDVLYVPNITMSTNVTSSEFKESQYVRFHCAGESNPRVVNWRWERNDSTIPGATSDTLIIPSISYDYHNNKISCIASNRVGSSRVDRKLDVKFAARIMHITEVVGADMGKPAELKCEAIGNPAPIVTWRRKNRGGRVAGSGRHITTVSVKSVYKIDRVEERNFGWYVCTASVANFPPASAEAMLLKNDKPNLRSEKDQMATEGKAARLECLAHSIPKPDRITWYGPGGKRINFATSGRFSEERIDMLYGIKTILHITSAQSGDFGYYNCTVTNAYGTVSEQIQLVEKHVLPITFIIIGVIAGVVVMFVAGLACVLYMRCRNEKHQGSVLGSYTDTDSSSDKTVKKRDKLDSPSTLMGQLRQDYNKEMYRFSADYDDMPYKEQPQKANNNGYGYIEPYETYSDHQVYDGEYVHRGDDLIPERLGYDPLYGSGNYSMSSFRANNYDTSTPPPTMTRLTPLHMSNSKLATDV